MTTVTDRKKSYANLDPLQQLTCHLLAIGGESVPLSEIGRILKTSLSYLADEGLKVPTKLTNPDAERIVIALEEHGLANVDPGKKFSTGRTTRD